MISAEIINTKINMLPPASQKEVLDFIDDLLEKSAKYRQLGKNCGVGRLGEMSFGK